MPQEVSQVKERRRIRLGEPQDYRVVMHNDDITTMDFVVMVLKLVFFKPDADAESLMMKIHKEGKASIGVYTYDIAASKVRKTLRMARKEGYPLELTIEPEFPGS